MPDTQYFTNIDGKYVKDAEARQQLNDLEDYVESLDQPWEPLEDGYSNFWFELTNDTLSPWLNFSAKTENAVIDWGDGSGEVALDTLTPTHTYSKAGRYIVKVKGVTGIAAQHIVPYQYQGAYLSALKNVELNNEITSVGISAFSRCAGLVNITFKDTTITSLPNYALYMCTCLNNIVFSSSTTTIGTQSLNNCFCLDNLVLPINLKSIGISAFAGNTSFNTIIIPSSVTTIENTVFSSCGSLSDIHVQAQTPPSLGANVFVGLPSNYIIYVPVGYAETYKAASGWSTYADHILEEGQTPNRAMLAKFNSTKTEEVKDDELYKDENR